MKAHEFVTEAPLKTYDTMGDFEKSGPFRGPDKKLVPNPTNMLKTQKFFEKTPYDFRLFFSNLPGTGKYREAGEMTREQIRNIFKDQADAILADTDEAITVVFVGNSGDAKVPLTPWVMAHRLGHAIQATTRGKDRTWSAWGEMERYFVSQILSIFEYCYNVKIRNFSDLMSNYSSLANALFNAIGTQRSSRTNKIKRPYEFIYEMFAQYIGTGRVTLNPLPLTLKYGRQNWGRSSNGVYATPEYRDEESRTEATDVLARDMSIMLDDVLGTAVRRIYVM